MVSALAGTAIVAVAVIFALRSQKRSPTFFCHLCLQVKKEETKKTSEHGELICSSCVEIKKEEAYDGEDHS